MACDTFRSSSTSLFARDDVRPRIYVDRAVCGSIPASERVVQRAYAARREKVYEGLSADLTLFLVVFRDPGSEPSPFVGKLNPSWAAHSSISWGRSGRGKKPLSSPPSMRLPGRYLSVYTVGELSPNEPALNLRPDSHARARQHGLL